MRPLGYAFCGIDKILEGEKTSNLRPRPDWAEFASGSGRYVALCVVWLAHRCTAGVIWSESSRYRYWPHSQGRNIASRDRFHC